MVSDTPLFELLAAHQNITVAVVSGSVFISLCLIARLWVTHRSESVLRKLVWTLVLLVPLIGWIVYGGFHHTPSASGVPASTEHSAHISGTGADGHF